VIVSPSDPRVLALLDLLQGEYVGLYGEPDPNPQGGLDTAVPPHGGVLLLSDPGDAGRAVAVGGWTLLPDLGKDVACLRRVYVHWAKRRRGFGRALLGEIEDHARRCGVRVLALEVGHRQVAALSMYRSHGYSTWKPFGYYADQHTSAFLAKPLGEG
jgi:putative acetyltransferase